MDSSHVDYRCFVWERARVVAIAGDSKAVLLDLGTGALRISLDLVLIDKPSLDVIDFLSGDSGRLLAIGSTRRVFVLNDECDVIASYSPKGPVVSLESISEEYLTLREFDVKDPRCPVVRRDVAIASPR